MFTLLSVSIFVSKLIPRVLDTMNKFLKYKIAIVSILLPAMLLLAGNAVFNWHVHKSVDGKMIVHAHPFHKAGSSQGTNSHSHSSQECFSINQLTSFLFVLSVVFFINAIIKEAKQLLQQYTYQIKVSYLDYLIPNRAPPVLA